jgi:hypothetical protein
MAVVHDRETYDRPAGLQSPVEIVKKSWCPRWDLNPHAVAGSGF